MSKTTHPGAPRLAAWALLLLGAIAVPSAGIFAAGEGEDARSSRTTDLETVKQDWSEAIESIKGYSAAQRDEALEKAGEQLDAMDTRIEALERDLAERWSDLGASARERREASLRSLRRQRRELAEWYGGMKHSSRGAWEDVKRGFVDAYRTLGESFGEAVEEFRADEPAGTPDR